MDTTLKIILAIMLSYVPLSAQSILQGNMSPAPTGGGPTYTWNASESGNSGNVFASCGGFDTPCATVDTVNGDLAVVRCVSLTGVGVNTVSDDNGETWTNTLSSSSGIIEAWAVIQNASTGDGIYCSRDYNVAMTIDGYTSSTGWQAVSLDVNDLHSGFTATTCASSAALAATAQANELITGACFTNVVNGPSSATTGAGYTPPPPYNTPYTMAQTAGCNIAGSYGCSTFYLGTTVIWTPYYITQSFTSTVTQSFTSGYMPN